MHHTVIILDAMRHLPCLCWMVRHLGWSAPLPKNGRSGARYRQWTSVSRRCYKYIYNCNGKSKCCRSQPWQVSKIPWRALIAQACLSLNWSCHMRFLTLLAWFKRCFFVLVHISKDTISNKYMSDFRTANRKILTRRRPPRYLFA